MTCRPPVRIVVALLTCALLCATRAAPAGPVIFDMDAVRHRPTEVTDAEGRKSPAGTAEPAEGKFGKAVRFTFADGARGGFMVAPVRETADWDRADGFS